jgi:hypothetical protein
MNGDSGRLMEEETLFLMGPLRGGAVKYLKALRQLKFEGYRHTLKECINNEKAAIRVRISLSFSILYYILHFLTI